MKTTMTLPQFAARGQFEAEKRGFCLKLGAMAKLEMVNSSQLS